MEWVFGLIGGFIFGYLLKAIKDQVDKDAKVTRLSPVDYGFKPAPKVNILNNFELLDGYSMAFTRVIEDSIKTSGDKVGSIDKKAVKAFGMYIEHLEVYAEHTPTESTVTFRLDTATKIIIIPGENDVLTGKRL